MSNTPQTIDYDALAKQTGATDIGPAPAPVQQPSTDQTQNIPDLNTMISQTSSKYQVDPNLIHALVKQESNYNPHAISKKGAQGLMQLMPETSRRLGVTDPFDPQSNLEGGVQHFKSLLGKYKGDVNLALAAYNAGEGAVEQYGGVPPYSETQDYVKKIVGEYQSNKNPGAPLKLKPPAEYDALAKQHGATQLSVDYDSLAKQAGASGVDNTNFPVEQKPSAFKEFMRRPIGSYANKLLGLNDQTFSERVDDMYPKTVYLLTGKLVNKQTGTVEGWEPMEHPFVSSTTARALPGMIHDAAHIVAGFADFVSSPEGLVNLILPVITGGLSVPLQAAYYLHDTGSNLIDSVAKYHENPTPDTLQAVLTNGAMLAFIAHGSLDGTLNKVTKEAQDTLGITKGAEVAAKPVNAIREAGAKAAGEVAGAFENRAASKDLVVKAREASRLSSLATVKKMVDAGMIEQADFDKVKGLDAEQLGKYVRQTLTQDAFNDALPERQITTTATKDGTTLRETAAKVPPDVLAKEKVITDALENPNNSKIGSSLLKDLSLTNLENLDKAGQTPFADQALTTVENHVFRSNAMLPTPEAQIKGLLKDFRTMADNDLFERSPRLKQEYEGLKSLDDLNNALKSLKKAAPPGYGLVGKILDKLTTGKIFGASVLGVLLGHAELGGTGIALSIGRWVLDRPSVLNAAARVCRGLQDALSTEVKGAEAVAPAAKESEAVTAPTVAPTAPTEPNTPVTAPTEAKPTEASPTVPAKPVETPVAEAEGKFIQNPDHANIAKAAGVEYHGTSKDGDIVWVTDPRISADPIAFPADKFSPEEVEKAVKESKTAEEEARQARETGRAIKIGEKISGVGREERPGFISRDEYAELQERYPGTPISPELRERNAAVNEYLKAQEEGREPKIAEPKEVKPAKVAPPKTEVKAKPKEAKPKEAKAKADEEAAIRRSALDEESKKQFGEKATYWSLNEDQQRKVIDAVDKAEATKPAPKAEEAKPIIPKPEEVKTAETEYSTQMPQPEVAGTREQLKAGTPEATAFINKFRADHPETKLDDAGILKYNNDRGKLEFRSPKKGETPDEAVARLNKSVKEGDNKWETFPVEGSNRVGIRRYKTGTPAAEMNYTPGEEMPAEINEKPEAYPPGEELHDAYWRFKEEARKKAETIQKANDDWMARGHKVEELSALPLSMFKQRIVSILHEFAGHAFSFMMSGIPIKEAALRRVGGAYIRPDWEKMSLNPSNPFVAADTVSKVLGAIVDSAKGREIFAKGLAAGPAIDRLINDTNNWNSNAWREGTDAYYSRMLIEALGSSSQDAMLAFEEALKNHQALVSQYPSMLQNLVDYLVDPKHSNQISFNGKEIHKIVADAAGIENPFEAPKPVKAKLPTQKSLKFPKGSVFEQMTDKVDEGKPLSPQEKNMLGGEEVGYSFDSKTPRQVENTMRKIREAYEKQQADLNISQGQEAAKKSAFSPEAKLNFIGEESPGEFDVPKEEKDKINEGLKSLSDVGKMLEDYSRGKGSPYVYDTRAKTFKEKVTGNPADVKDVVKRAMDYAVPEIKRMLEEDQNGLKWYSKDVDKMAKGLQKLHPELLNPDQLDYYKIITAITSNGQPPGPNIATSEKIWTTKTPDGLVQPKAVEADGSPHLIYNADKEVAYWQQQHPGEKPPSKNSVDGMKTYYSQAKDRGSLYQGRWAPQVADTGFIALNKLISEKGLHNAMQWLREKHPIDELLSRAPEGQKDWIKVTADEDGNNYGSLIYGPKIGRFFQNLKGNWDVLTADRWFSRSWNRWMGTMFDEDPKTGNIKVDKKGNPVMVDATRNPHELAVMQQSMDYLVSQLKDKGIQNVAEAQAVLWYYEKELYRRYGYVQASDSYSDVVGKLVDKQPKGPEPTGIPENRGQAKEGGKVPFGPETVRGPEQNEGKIPKTNLRGKAGKESVMGKALAG